MRCFFVILIVLLQATLSVAKDSLCVWIMPNGASPKEKLETELQKFTDKTGIPTKVVVLDWGEAWNRISSALEQGKDLPAVLQVGTTWIPYFASKGYLLPLNPWLSQINRERFIPVSFNTTHIEGDSTIYSVPWFVDARALLANQKILKDNGINPNELKTYQDFRAALRKVNQAQMKLEDGTPIEAFAFPGKSDWNIPHNFAPWIWSDGGDFIRKDENGYRSALLDSGTLRGIAKYLDFVIDSLVNRSNLTQNTAQIIQRFNNGELAFILNTAEIAMLTRIASVNGGLEGSRIGNDGVIVLPVPQGDAGSIGFVGGSNLSIPAKYPNKDAALKLLMFLTSDSSVDAYTKTIGFLPSVQSALVSWEKDSVYKALVECLKYGKAYTSIPQWGEAENILVALFSDIWAVLEFEDLYSEQRIYGILSKYHAEMNKLLQHENQEISFEEFQKIWNSVIVLRETEKQETEKTESQNGFFKNFSVGLFVMMMIFGFAFTYRRKR